MRFVLWCAAGCLLASSGHDYAQELSLLAGPNSVHGEEETYSWTLEYLHGMGQNFAFSLAWLNEGHVPQHHRDGQSAQLWVRAPLLDKRLWIEAGAGPYFYFDTAQAEQGASYSDDHGWGGVYSVATVWYGSRRWIYQLRANHIATSLPRDSTTLQFGIGYQLEPPEGRGPIVSAARYDRNTTRNEITVLAGTTIVNSFESQQDTAFAIEYRRGLRPHVDWTVMWMDEGDARLIRRNGIASQLWLARAFFAQRLALSAGVGVYLALDEYRANQPSEEGDEATSGIITASASYRFGSRWLSRLSWNRIVTDYSRDTDVILVGVGYRF